MRPVRLFAAILALLLALGGLAGSISAALAAPPLPEAMPGELVVQFRPGVTPAHKGAALGPLKGRLKRVVRRAASGPAAARAGARDGDLELVAVDPSLSRDRTVQALEKHPDVAFAEPNYIYYGAALPNDPYYTNGQLWGMAGPNSSPANPYGSRAAEAWAAGITGSASVYVGVIDEGIQFAHPDLAANVWTNPYEIPGNGIDDDGNGYVDDVHGWNFDQGTNQVYIAGGDDHGTHVAGTIGAKGGNGIGVAGVNWDVTMISAQFLNATTNSGTLAGAVSAIDYVTDLKTRHGLRIVATNNSWGCNGCYSQAVHAAMVRGAQADILFVVAAMNSSTNIDTTPYYPAADSTTADAGYDAVISVAAIDSGGALAGFSDYGPTTVDLGAPGVAVNSTVPDGAYASYQGTSMATPHVTGAVALLASQAPSANAATLRNAILSSTTATPALAGKTVTGGRLNIVAALNSIVPPTPPARPTALAATSPTASSLTLNWTDASGDETYFKLERHPGTGPATPFQPAGMTAANATSFVDGGLSANTTYTYRVSACNLACSTPSDPATGTTLAVQRPANDDFGAAAAVTQLPASFSLNTLNAALESGEPSPACGAIGHTVWYSLTPAVGGQVTLDLTGSDFDTLVGVYTGDGLGGLTAVGCDDDSGGNLTSLLSFDAAAGTTYRIQVGGYGAKSGNLSMKVGGTATVGGGAPAAPSAVNRGAVTGTSVALAWTDTAANESGFQVQRKVGTAGAWADVALTPPGTSAGSGGMVAFTDTTAQPGTVNWYRVRAVNGIGRSAWVLMVGSAATPLAAPSALTLGGVTRASVALAWPAQAGVTGYVLLRKVGVTGGYGAVQTLGDPAAASWTDTTVLQGVAYHYAIRSFRTLGGSTVYSPYTYLTGTASTPLDPPSGLKPTGLTPTSVTLSWTAPCCAHGYVLERKGPGEASYSVVSAGIGADTATFTQGGLTPGATYYYRLKARRTSGGQDVFSAYAYATVKTPAA